MASLGATAAAKSLQSCPTLCDPIDSSPPGSSVPGILQARTLERVAIPFSKGPPTRILLKLCSRSTGWSSRLFTRVTTWGKGEWPELVKDAWHRIRTDIGTWRPGSLETWSVILNPGWLEPGLVQFWGVLLTPFQSILPQVSGSFFS